MLGSAVQVGVLSDTHGLFDRKLIDLFEGSDVILHAGDVCGQDVLDQLASLAPVRATCGNCDIAPLSVALPRWRTEEIGGHRLLILHELGKPERMTPAASALVANERPNIVISGHSHQGRIAVRDGILFLNPGSAGRKRFRLLRSAALLSLAAGEATATLFSLESSRPAPVAQGSWSLERDGGRPPKLHPSSALPR
jgi:uncharacterized protein